MDLSVVVLWRGESPLFTSKQTNDCSGFVTVRFPARYFPQLAASARGTYKVAFSDRLWQQQPEEYEQLDIGEFLDRFVEPGEKRDPLFVLASDHAGYRYKELLAAIREVVMDSCEKGAVSEFPCGQDAGAGEVVLHHFAELLVGLVDGIEKGIDGRGE